MHEMALAEGVLAVVLEAADDQPVRRVQLRVGTLQRVVPDSLQFCFQLAAQGTPAAEAVLELTDVAARLRCNRCGAESEIDGSLFQCRSCGAVDIDIIAGDEILVDAVELDSGWRYRPGARDGKPASVEVSAEHLAEHAQADAERHDAAEHAR